MDWKSFTRFTPSRMVLGLFESSTLLPAVPMDHQARPANAFKRGGHIYGVVTTGGANGAGVVFELRPTPSWRMGFQDPLFFQRVPLTGSSPTVRYFYAEQVISTARLITAERFIMTWVQFTNCRPTAVEDGNEAVLYSFELRERWE